MKLFEAKLYGFQMCVAVKCIELQTHDGYLLFMIYKSISPVLDYLKVQKVKIENEWENNSGMELFMFGV